jgi:hypothetical protein
MKMTTLYAALSGAFLLGSAALVSAQNMTTTTTDKSTSPQSGAVHTTRDKMDKATTAMTPGGNAGQGISRDEYKREKDRIESEAKAAKANCKPMHGNAKDICQAEAKANEKVAKKELDYKNKPTEKNKTDWEKMKVEAAYEVAKEKCDDASDKVACRKQAKADKDRGMAAAKSGASMASNTSTSTTSTTTTTTKTK